MSSTQPTQRLPLFALLSANAISLTGNVLTMIAIPWFVLQTTGSPSKTGLTAFFTALPAIIAGIFGGAIIDRLGYKRASIISDLASGLTVALIPLLYYTVGLEFWQLLALVFLGALLDAPGATARSSLLPDLAELADIRLERVTAWDDGISRASRLLGAPLAGVLIVLVGPAQALWLDAASFMLSAALTAWAVPAAKRDADESPQNYLADLREGISYIRHDRLILAIVISVMITNFLDVSLSSVALPVYVKELYGSAFDLGLLIATFGGAAFTGAMIFSAIGHRLPRRLTFAVSFIIVGLRFWALALFPPLPVLLVLHALTGVAAGALNPILATVQYERIPATMRARVFGTITAGAFLGMPLGVLITGYALEWVGLRPVLLTLGTLYLITTLSLLINPALREMDRQPEPDAPLAEAV
ncbi:MAG: MFS transporter [Chloroflexi bacterium]|nr:MFS transporter [Chloroflexota bacterium]